MEFARNTLRNTFIACALGGLTFGSLAVTTGCDTEREVVDIETPAGEVEVNEDTATGEVEVDVSDDQ